MNTTTRGQLKLSSGCQDKNFKVTSCHKCSLFLTVLYIVKYVNNHIIKNKRRYNFVLILIWDIIFHQKGLGLCNCAQNMAND